MAQSLDERWRALAPHVRVFGPKDGRPRPTVLLFHGCGGMRPHVDVYGRAAAAEGWRAFAVDSYAPRGWSRAYGVAFVCTGLAFWGRERAGDVLAAVAGVAARPEVDASRLVLGGWSHGGWSIMDLMTMARAEEAGVVGPMTALDGVRSLFLAYPYGGFGALSRRRAWRRRPRVLAAIAERDHVTNSREARRLYEAPRRAGAEVELWEVPGATHSFDELTGVFPMRYDAGLAREAEARFRSFLRSN